MVETLEWYALLQVLGHAGTLAVKLVVEYESFGRLLGLVVLHLMETLLSCISGGMLAGLTFGLGLAISELSSPRRWLENDNEILLFHPQEKLLFQYHQVLGYASLLMIFSSLLKENGSVLSFVAGTTSLWVVAKLQFLVTNFHAVELTQRYWSLIYLLLATLFVTIECLRLCSFGPASHFLSNLISFAVGVEAFHTLCYGMMRQIMLQEEFRFQERFLEMKIRFRETFIGATAIVLATTAFPKSLIAPLSNFVCAVTIAAGQSVMGYDDNAGVVKIDFNPTRQEAPEIANFRAMSIYAYAGLLIASYSQYYAIALVPEAEQIWRFGTYMSLIVGLGFMYHLRRNLLSWRSQQESVSLMLKVTEKLLVANKFLYVTPFLGLRVAVTGLIATLSAACYLNCARTDHPTPDKLVRPQAFVFSSLFSVIVFAVNLEVLRNGEDPKPISWLSHFQKLGFICEGLLAINTMSQLYF